MENILVALIISKCAATIEPESPRSTSYISFDKLEGVARCSFPIFTWPFAGCPGATKKGHVAREQSGFVRCKSLLEPFQVTNREKERGGE